MKKGSLKLVLGLVLIAALFFSMGLKTEVKASEEGAPVEVDLGGYSVEKPLVLKLGTMQPKPENHVNFFATQMQNALDERTGGAIVLDMYWGTVGTEREVIDQVLSGTLDMAVNSTANLSNYSKVLDVFDLSFLFDDYEDIYRVLSSDTFKEILDTFSSTGISLIGADCIGFRTICTTQKAGMTETYEDIKNKTLRVAEGLTFISQYESWGAAPVAMAASEIMSALQNNTIDGCDHTLNILATNGQCEYIKNVATWGQSTHFACLTMNNDKLASLPESIQEIIKSAAIEAGLTTTRLIAEKTETEYKEILESQYGVTFFTPSEEDRAKMKEAVEPLFEEFVATHEFGAYAQKIRDICNEE